MGFQKGHKINQGKKYSKTRRKRISLALKGKHLSQKTEFKKGHKFFKGGEKGWFKKNGIPWNRNLTKETDERVKSYGLKGSKVTRKQYENGRKLSPSCFNKGNLPWNKLEFREPYPYEFNEQLKEFIRERDNHNCQICKTNQEEFDKKLHVHHIDFDKKNNSPFNLISLCKSCHGKVNCLNRNIWINFFNNVLSDLNIERKIEKIIN
jgi:5-methylcytosine-specific restriction endonuclease McrA